MSSRYFPIINVGWYKSCWKKKFSSAEYFITVLVWFSFFRTGVTKFGVQVCSQRSQVQPPILESQINNKKAEKGNTFNMATLGRTKRSCDPYPVPSSESCHRLNKGPEVHSCLSGLCKVWFSSLPALQDHLSQCCDNMLEL